MIRRPPRSTLDRSSAASDVYKRQIQQFMLDHNTAIMMVILLVFGVKLLSEGVAGLTGLSLIHISEPTRPY